MIPSPSRPKSIFFAIAIAIAIVTIIIPPSFSAAGIPPYTNYTVGGDSGWHFNSTTMTPGANYSSWSSPISFYLGDILCNRLNLHFNFNS
ncbi:hypothetical protein ZOSMA_105G00370 [Zostera marina]|uniref:Phytocyanin domain-containing protein n=1 Tax=Zostera marina TaxID=29655 RepID=A0A0K9Q635_ZOSMR|nr:hypothetical protein ZOSMA_105G00370 [Zostera marina]